MLAILYLSFSAKPVIILQFLKIEIKLKLSFNKLKSLK